MPETCDQSATNRICEAFVEERIRKMQIRCFVFCFVVQVVCGSFEEERAVHTLRLELNARFDPSQTYVFLTCVARHALQKETPHQWLSNAGGCLCRNILFPAFQPSYWQLIDWNYGIGPTYPIDPRDISNISLRKSRHGVGLGRSSSAL